MDEFWERMNSLIPSVPIPANEVLKNVALFQDADSVRRLLFFDWLYQTHLVNLPGMIMEFGVRWGRDLVWLRQLHEIHEPDATRGLVGFDTFAGHVGQSDVDGENEHVRDGAFSVPAGYAEWLIGFLVDTKPNENMAVWLVEGDVRVRLPEFLEVEPHTLVSLAVFDLDLYEPTRDALEALKPYLHEGSILVFDELAAGQYPGETVAVREVFGNSLGLRRLPFGGSASYAVLDGGTV